MSPKEKIEGLLNRLLGVPLWYADILLAQLPTREQQLFTKQALKRIINTFHKVNEARIGVKEVPELGPAIHAGQELLRRWGIYFEPKEETSEEMPDLGPTRHSLQEFLRRCGLEPKEETSGAKAIPPKTTGRPVAPPPRWPMSRPPRSSAQQIGALARARRGRSIGPEDGNHETEPRIAP